MNRHLAKCGILLSTLGAMALVGCAASGVKRKYTAMGEQERARYADHIRNLESRLATGLVDLGEIGAFRQVEKQVVACDADEECKHSAYDSFVSQIKLLYPEADFTQVLLSCHQTCSTPKHFEYVAAASHNKSLQVRIEAEMAKAEERHYTVLAALNADFQREYTLARERDRQAWLAFSEGLRAASQSMQQPAYQSGYTAPAHHNGYSGTMRRPVYGYSPPTFGNSYYGSSASSWSRSTSQSIGRFTYYSGDITGTTQQIGNFRYHNFNNGLSGSSQRIGQFEYHNFNNGLSGTTQRIGQFEYYNFSDGVTGTSQRIGNFDYTHFSDGTRCTTQHIGSMAYTNCN